MWWCMWSGPVDGSGVCGWRSVARVGFSAPPITARITGRMGKVGVVKVNTHPHANMTLRTTQQGRMVLPLCSAVQFRRSHHELDETTLYTLRAGRAHTYSHPHTHTHTQRLTRSAPTNTTQGHTTHTHIITISPFFLFFLFFLVQYTNPGLDQEILSQHSSCFQPFFNK